MKYRNGELSVSMSNTLGRYKCIYETKNTMWVGYTHDKQAFDYSTDDKEILYRHGFTQTLKESKSIIERANRTVYRAAKRGNRIKIN